MKKLIILFFIVSLFSCESNNKIIDPDNLLIGSWINPAYNNEEMTFTRANTIPSDSYGISFKEDGSFLEHTSGWCGTPPLTFFNIDGNWLLEDSLIKITTQYYPSNYQWRIISLTEEKLVVKRELSEQEVDHRNLMDMFDEISNLAYSVSCTDANNWTFTAYGSKACGGPQGFLPYSTQIDTVAFLQKVEAYTEAERLYNIKWSIISTCDLPSTPNRVECQNGYPVLKY